MAILFVAGGIYWHIVCLIAGVNEPWDAPAYWTLAYPTSLILSGGAGLYFRKRGWLAGLLMSFAQLPVMWINNGTGSMWAVGLLFLSVLALPAVAISTLTGLIAVRRQPA